MANPSDHLQTIFICHIIKPGHEIYNLDTKSPCLSLDMENYNILYTPITSKEDSVQYALRVKDKITLDQFGSELYQNISVLILLDKDWEPSMEKILVTLLGSLPPVIITIYSFASAQFKDTFKIAYIEYNPILTYPKVSYDLRDKKITFPVDDSSNRILNCTKWFGWYMGNVFQCAKGRLQQQTATCYLNSNVNFFLLSESLKKSILYHILNDLSKEEKNKIIKPFNDETDTCEVGSNYFFKIIYQSVCNSIFSSGKEDVFFRKGVSKSTNFIKPFATDHFFGDNTGSLLDSFEKLLHFLPPTTKANIFIETVYQAINSDGSLNHQLHPIQHDKGAWLLEGCLIGLIPWKITEEGTGAFDTTQIPHAVLGYFCNGVPKVYDSNNIYYNFNWITGEGYDQFLDEIRSIYLYNSSDDIYIFRNPIYLYSTFKTWANELQDLSSLCFDINRSRF